MEVITVSTEEKTTSKPEIAELSKFKQHFKLDKKHIQGFIAGILLCAIAFTGLYYGTDGRFFKGSFFPGRLPFVTDENFETEVLQSDKIVLVVADINYLHGVPGNSTTYNHMAYAYDLATKTEFSGKIKALFLYPDSSSSNTQKAYNIQKDPSILVFHNGQLVYQDKDRDNVGYYVIYKCGLRNDPIFWR